MWIRFSKIWSWTIKLYKILTHSVSYLEAYLLYKQFLFWDLDPLHFWEQSFCATREPECQTYIKTYVNCKKTRTKTKTHTSGMIQLGSAWCPQDTKITLEVRGVGRRTTFPNSLSSSANIPGFSVKSFTFTAGSGWLVVKSPCVSHLKIEEHVAIFLISQPTRVSCQINLTY